MIRVALVAHLSELSGSGRSLLASGLHMDRTRFFPYLIVPAEGPLMDESVRRGMETVVVDNPEVSIAAAGAAARARVLYQRLKYTRRLEEVFRANATDVVCVNTTASVFPGFAARRQRLPILWRVHEVIENHGRATRIKLSLIERLASAIVYDSHTGARHFPAARVARKLVFPNHVDPTVFRPTLRDDGVRGALGAGDRDCLVVSNGLFPRKGADLFVEAAMKIMETASGSQWRFAIVGPRMPEQADFIAGLEKRIAQGPLAGRMVFAGPRTDMPAVLSAADIFVSPSRNEAWPIAVLEALACATPVVATEVGDCRMMLDGGTRGTLVPPEDSAALSRAIIDADTDAEAVARRAKLARNWVEEQFGRPDFWRPLEELTAGLVR